MTTKLNYTTLTPGEWWDFIAWTYTTQVGKVDPAFRKSVETWVWEGKLGAEFRPRRMAWYLTN